MSAPTDYSLGGDADDLLKRTKYSGMMRPNVNADGSSLSTLYSVDGTSPTIGEAGQRAHRDRSNKHVQHNMMIQFDRYAMQDSVRSIPRINNERRDATEDVIRRAYIDSKARNSLKEAKAKAIRDKSKTISSRPNSALSPAERMALRLRRAHEQCFEGLVFVASAEERGDLKEKPRALPAVREETTFNKRKLHQSVPSPAEKMASNLILTADKNAMRSTVKPLPSPAERMAARLNRAREQGSDALVFVSSQEDKDESSNINEVLVSAEKIKRPATMQRCSPSAATRMAANIRSTAGTKTARHAPQMQKGLPSPAERMAAKLVASAEKEAAQRAAKKKKVAERAAAKRAEEKRASEIEAAARRDALKAAERKLKAQRAPPSPAERMAARLKSAWEQGSAGLVFVASEEDNIDSPDVRKSLDVVMEGEELTVPHKDEDALQKQFDFVMPEIGNDGEVEVVAPDARTPNYISGRTNFSTAMTATEPSMITANSLEAINKAKKPVLLNVEPRPLSEETLQAIKHSDQETSDALRKADEILRNLQRYVALGAPSLEILADRRPLSLSQTAPIEATGQMKEVKAEGFAQDIAQASKNRTESTILRLQGSNEESPKVGVSPLEQQAAADLSLPQVVPSTSPDSKLEQPENQSAKGDTSVSAATSSSVKEDVTSDLLSSETTEKATVKVATTLEFSTPLNASTVKEVQINEPEFVDDDSTVGCCVFQSAIIDNEEDENAKEDVQEVIDETSETYQASITMEFHGAAIELKSLADEAGEEEPRIASGPTDIDNEEGENVNEDAQEVIDKTSETYEASATTELHGAAIELKSLADEALEEEPPTVSEHLESVTHLGTDSACGELFPKPAELPIDTSLRCCDLAPVTGGNKEKDDLNLLAAVTVSFEELQQQVNHEVINFDPADVESVINRVQERFVSARSPDLDVVSSNDLTKVCEEDEIVNSIGYGCGCGVVPEMGPITTSGGTGIYKQLRDGVDASANDDDISKDTPDRIKEREAVLIIASRHQEELTELAVAARARNADGISPADDKSTELFATGANACEEEDARAFELGAAAVKAHEEEEEARVAAIAKARKEEEAKAAKLAAIKTRTEEEARAVELDAAKARKEEVRAVELAAAKAREEEEARSVELAAASIKARIELAAIKAREEEEARAAELAAAKFREEENAKASALAVIKAREEEDAKVFELAAAKTRQEEEARAAELAAVEARMEEEVRAAELVIIKARELEEAEVAGLAAIKAREEEEAKAAELAIVKAWEEERAAELAAIRAWEEEEEKRSADLAFAKVREEARAAEAEAAAAIKAREEEEEARVAELAIAKAREEEEEARVAELAIAKAREEEQARAVELAANKAHEDEVELIATSIQARIELAAITAREDEEARAAELAAAKLREEEDAKASALAIVKARKEEEVRAAELAATTARDEEDARVSAIVKACEEEEARAVEIAADEARKEEDVRAAELAAIKVRKEKEARATTVAEEVAITSASVVLEEEEATYRLQEEYIRSYQQGEQVASAEDADKKVFALMDNSLEKSPLHLTEGIGKVEKGDSASTVLFEGMQAEKSNQVVSPSDSCLERVVNRVDERVFDVEANMAATTSDERMGEITTLAPRTIRMVNADAESNVVVNMVDMKLENTSSLLNVGSPADLHTTSSGSDSVEMISFGCGCGAVAEDKCSEEDMNGLLGSMKKSVAQTFDKYDLSTGSPDRIKQWEAQLMASRAREEEQAKAIEFVTKLAREEEQAQVKALAVAADRRIKEGEATLAANIVRCEGEVEAVETVDEKDHADAAKANQQETNDAEVTPFGNIDYDGEVTSIDVAAAAKKSDEASAIERDSMKESRLLSADIEDELLDESYAIVEAFTASFDELEPQEANEVTSPTPSAVGRVVNRVQERVVDGNDTHPTMMADETDTVVTTVALSDVVAEDKDEGDAVDSTDSARFGCSMVDAAEPVLSCGLVDATAPARDLLNRVVGCGLVLESGLGGMESLPIAAVSSLVQESTKEMTEVCSKDRIKQWEAKLVASRAQEDEEVAARALAVKAREDEEVQACKARKEKEMEVCEVLRNVEAGASSSHENACGSSVQANISKTATVLESFTALQAVPTVSFDEMQAYERDHIISPSPSAVERVVARIGNRVEESEASNIVVGSPSAVERVLERVRSRVYAGEGGVLVAFEGNAGVERTATFRAMQSEALLMGKSQEEGEQDEGRVRLEYRMREERKE